MADKEYNLSLLVTVMHAVEELQKSKSNKNDFDQVTKNQ